MNKPFWLMYPPKKYYQFRRQTLNNWLDLHSHMPDEYEFWPGWLKLTCYYCGKSGLDELSWKLPTCKGQPWHIDNLFKPGGAETFGIHPKNTQNPYYKR